MATTATAATASSLSCGEDLDNFLSSCVDTSAVKGVLDAALTVVDEPEALLIQYDANKGVYYCNKDVGVYDFKSGGYICDRHPIELLCFTDDDSGRCSLRVFKEHMSNVAEYLRTLNKHELRTALVKYPCCLVTLLPRLNYQWFDVIQCLINDYNLSKDQCTNLLMNLPCSNGTFEGRMALLTKYLLRHPEEAKERLRSNEPESPYNYADLAEAYNYDWHRVLNEMVKRGAIADFARQALLLI